MAYLWSFLTMVLGALLLGTGIGAPILVIGFIWFMGRLAVGFMDFTDGNIPGGPWS